MKRSANSKDADRYIAEAMCFLNDASRALAKAALALKDEQRAASSPPMRQRRRQRSPARTSRTGVYVGKTTGVDKQDLRKQFELCYGESLQSFDVAERGGHVRVFFEDEESQRQCLKDAASWRRDYGIDIHRLRN